MDQIPVGTPYLIIETNSLRVVTWRGQRGIFTARGIETCDNVFSYQAECRGILTNEINTHPWEMGPIVQGTQTRSGDQR